MPNIVAMIRIEHLCKYYGKDKMIVKALDDVSIDLPDKGMIFVVGKSGSGKSTFLNVIGGLDDITSGSVEIDGVNIASLSDNDLDKYRNNYIGIIYQNFNLFSNETVYQNIMSASLISNKDISDGDVDSICKKLELLEKKYTLVKNMSGGQCQRVAIARALIKNPDMILADEPTGNLDSKTAESIFNILQEISKDKLIIIVSHDIQSAEKYADRIITLADGQVLSDKVRNENIICDDKTIKISNENNISDEEIKSINEYLLDKDIKIARAEDKYIDFSGKVELQKEPCDFSKGKNKIKASFILSFKFFKSSWFSFLITAFVISATLGLLAFSQAFTMFDGHDTICEVAEQYDIKAYVMNKAYSKYGKTTKTETSYGIEVNDNDIEFFKNNGYDGNIYKIYNTSMLITNNNQEDGKIMSTHEIYSSFYSSSGLGVIVCDMDYINRLFGEDSVIAGSLYGLENSHKIIVTDYFADSLIYRKKANKDNSYVSMDSNDPYQKIVNKKIMDRYTIGAVVKTNYKERYNDILEMYDKANKEPVKSKGISSLIYNSENFTRFLDEANSVLNFGYSINPNYETSYVEESEITFAKGMSATITNDIGNYSLLGSEKWVHINDALKSDEIIISTSIFNKIFNTDYSTNIMFENEADIKNINLSLYSADKDISSDIANKTIRLKIVGLFTPIKDNPNKYAYVSKDTLKAYLYESTMPYALLFDNIDMVYEISETGQSNYFYTNMAVFSPLVNVFNIIEIFSEIFSFIAIILIAIAFLVIVSQNLKVIKKNQYRVGVYRSLGYSSTSIAIASILNIAYLICAIFVGTIIFVYAFNGLINTILVESFIKYLNISMLEGYVLIDASINVIGIYIGAAFGLGLLSIFAPLIYIKRLKPNLILKKAE